MLEAGGGFRLESKTLEMRFRCPLAESNDFERNRAVETFLPRTKHYALTASANFFQQLVVAKLSEHLCRRAALLVEAVSALVLHRDGLSSLVHEQTKAGLEETTWAASLRSVGWDFGPALWANSEYASHYQEPLVRSSFTA